MKINNAHTLPETNEALENGWLEDEFPFGKAYFRDYVIFREGITQKLQCSLKHGNLLADFFSPTVPFSLCHGIFDDRVRLQSPFRKWGSHWIYTKV